MPVIPLLPSDSASLVEYKIYLSATVDSTLDDIASVQKWRRYYSGTLSSSLDMLLDKDQRAFLGNIISGDSADWPNDNMCRLVVDKHKSRLNVVGLTDQAGGERRFDESGESASALDQIAAWWKAADLDLWEGDIYRWAFRDAESYVIVWHDGIRPRFTVGTRYDGTQGIRVRWEDPETRTHALYASKFWRTLDPIGESSNILRQNIYTAVEVRKYVKPIDDRQYRAIEQRISGPKTDDGWYPYSDEGDTTWPIPWVDSDGPLGLAVIPFVSPRGSLVQAIIGLNNQLNKTNLDLLAAADQLGFGTFSIKYERLPTSTSSGSEVDVAGDGLGLRPGRVLETTGDVTKHPADDLSGLLAAKADTAQTIARNSDLPLHEIVPLTGQVPSGAALRQLEAALVKAVGECQARFGSAWRQAFDLAQRLERLHGRRGYVPQSIAPLWADAQAVDPAEESQNKLAEAQRIKALTDAGLPLAAALREVGWPEDKIARALSDKREADSAAQETLATQMLRAQRLMEQGQGMGEDAEPLQGEE